MARGSNDDCSYENTEEVEVERRCDDCKGRGGQETADGWEACDNPDCMGGKITVTVEECTDCGYRFW